MKRVQMRRGVKLPANTKSVARPSRWGNPWKVGAGPVCGEPCCMGVTQHTPYRWDRNAVVSLYRGHMQRTIAAIGRDFLAPLVGYDLACYCPLDQPCHADVLLELLA